MSYFQFGALAFMVIVFSVYSRSLEQKLERIEEGLKNLRVPDSLRGDICTDVEHIIGMREVRFSQELQKLQGDIREDLRFEIDSLKRRISD